jgi:hypothetical protein
LISDIGGGGDEHDDNNDDDFIISLELDGRLALKIIGIDEV